MLKDLSIVVPTFNGFDRLIVLCNWIKSQNFGGTVIVVSSDSVNGADKISEFKFVHFVHMPNSNVLEAMAAGFQLVSTRYSAYLGDDDLPTLSSYKKCCDFLDANPEYGSARGAMGFVNFSAIQNLADANSLSKIIFKFRTLCSDRYDGKSDLSQASSSARISSLVKNYIVSQFFVTRTDIAKRIYTADWSSSKEPHLAERVWCFAHATHTRTKFIPTHFLLRGLGLHRPVIPNNVDEKSKNFGKRVQTEYIKRVINNLQIAPSTKSRLAKEIFQQHQNKSRRRSSSIFMSLFWLKRLPRRIHFIMNYQSLEALDLFLSEKKNSQGNFKK